MMDRFKTARRALLATVGCVGIATVAAAPLMWQPASDVPPGVPAQQLLAAEAAYPDQLLAGHLTITPVKFNFTAPPLPDAGSTPAANSEASATPALPSVLYNEGVRRFPPIDVADNTPSARGSAFAPARSSPPASVFPPASEAPVSAGPPSAGKHRFTENTNTTGPPVNVSRSTAATRVDTLQPAPPQRNAPQQRLVSQPSKPVDPAAMAAVSHRANQLIVKGFSLAPRGAHFSARANFIQSLRIISQALDANQGGQQHTQALARGLRALDEASDFAPKGSKLEADLDVASIVTSHRTVALKDHPQLQNVTPLMALQQYYTFAQQQLSFASGKQPAASRALFGLGKLEAIIGGKDLEAKRMAGPRSMAYYQAAMMTDPANSDAANELGVLLANYGQWSDARAVLLHSLSKRPTSAGWHNIAVVHDHLQETELASRARYEMKLASQQRGRNPGAVQWVSAQEFAKSNPGPRAAAPRVETPMPGDGKTASRPEPAPWWAPWQR